MVWNDFVYLSRYLPRLTFDAAKSVAVSIVGSRLEYCNNVLHGTSRRNLECLLCVQNSLACVIIQSQLCYQCHIASAEVALAADPPTRWFKAGFYHIQKFTVIRTGVLSGRWNSLPSTADNSALRHHNLATPARRFIGLSLTFIRSLGFSGLKQHTCCHSWLCQLGHFKICF